MLFIPFIYGFIFSIIIFAFVFILTKRNEKYYLAPLMTFIAIVTTVFCSIFLVGGWEGMGIGVLAAGGLPAVIIGTILIPFITKNAKPKPKSDKLFTILLPITFILIFASIFLW